jgi:hypothetical protein
MYMFKGLWQDWYKKSNGLESLCYPGMFFFINSLSWECKDSMQVEQSSSFY